MHRVMAPDFRLSIVAPVFNEAGAIEPFAEEVCKAAEAVELQGGYELLLVDDGSRDGSSQVLDNLARRRPSAVKVIHLSRNFGQAAAVTAGLTYASGHAVIVMDADMQDDPAAFAMFLQKWQEGYEVVYAQRTSRAEPTLKRILFRLFYRLLGWMANIEMPLDAGNFALMDRRVVVKLLEIGERNRYLPGLRAWVGFRQAAVPVPRRARYDKSPRVGIRGLWTLAMNAVFSFSYVPIFVFRFLGVASLGLSFGLMAFALYHKLVTGKAVTAWASQLTALSFFGGVNLAGISVIGEYVARIYDEVKGRPMYVVDSVVGECKPFAAQSSEAATVSGGRTAEADMEARP